MEEYYEEKHGIEPPTWGMLLVGSLTCLATGLVFGYCIWGINLFV